MRGYRFETGGPDLQPIGLLAGQLGKNRQEEYVEGENRTFLFSKQAGLRPVKYRYIQKEET
ncbi:hypothetical protein TRIP_E370010 [uncultured Spirochaetota bacterium]|nr:hypothetical protein TRIP_E370010 [uncultured Spirochaetota bacterium]